MSQYGRFISYTAVTESLIGNDGIIVSPIAGNIHVVGTGGIATSGNIATATLTIAFSGMTYHAVIVGSSTGGIASLSAVGATGQGLMGNTGADPSWTGSPSFSGTVTAATGMTITNGPLTVGNTAVYPAVATMQFYKTNGGGATLSGDLLGDLNWLGNDGSGPLRVALIESVASGTIGVGRIAANLQFYTHPDSVAANPTLRMTIAPTGAVTIAAPDSGTGLTVSGGGSSITGTTNINTTGATVTSIGTGGTGVVNIGNATGNTFVTGNLYATLSSDTVASDIAFERSRLTGGAPAIVSGDTLGNLKFTGNDGTNFQVGAQITSVSSGTIAAGKIPANLVFSTKPDSATAIQTRMTISSAGAITMSGADAGTTLTITTGGETITAGGLTVTAGTITLPVAQFGIGLVSSTAAGVLSSFTPGAAGQLLVGTSITTIPTWTTTTFPTTSATGDIIYASGTNTLTGLTFVNTATRYLANTGGSATIPAWDQINLSNGVSNTLTVGHGGTGQTTLTAHGLLVGNTTSGINAMGVGTLNQFVVSGGISADPTWSTYTMPTTPVQGDLFYASSATVISQLAKNATASRYLSNSGTSNNPAWAQIDLSNGITGTLPIANGGTNQTSFTSNGAVYFNGTSLTNDANTTINSGTLTSTTLRTGSTTDYLTATAHTVTAAGSNANVDIAFATKGNGNVDITTARDAYNTGLIVFRGIATGGWSNSEWRTGQAVARTTDATPTAILSIPLVNSLMVSVKILINGFRDDYSNCLGGEILATAYRGSAGNITLVGAPIINVNYASTTDTTDIDALVNTGTQSLIFNVIGVAAQNFNWVATYTYMYTISNA